MTVQTELTTPSDLPALDGSLCRLCAECSKVWWNCSVLENESVHAMASLGALVPGWLLLVAENHALCWADIDDSHVPLLQHMADDLSAYLQQILGVSVFMFEHGPRQRGSDAGCTVDHAHLHLVPLLGFDMPSVNDVTRLVPDTVELFQATSIAEALDRARLSDNDYVLWGRDESYYVILAHKIPSQLMRRLVAESLGIAAWDWRNDWRLDIVTETLRLFDSKR